MPAFSSAYTLHVRQLKAFIPEAINARTEDQVRSTIDAFLWEAGRHLVAEELVVFPAFVAHFGLDSKRLSTQYCQKIQDVRFNPVICSVGCKWAHFVHLVER